MEKTPGNFQDNIHKAAYEAEYDAKPALADSLVNIAGRAAGRSLESLDGQWNFAPDLYDTCRRAHWYRETGKAENGSPLPVDWDWEGWERIKVPACWNMEWYELRYFEGFGVYTRAFRYEPLSKGERVFLRFEGAAYSASIFLNGRFLGKHDGASTPFNFEITDFLKEENRLIVSVDARRQSGRIPMENTDWFNYGGLYRGVFLVRVPEVFIKDYFVRLVPKSGFSKIACDINLSDKVNGNAVFSIPELGLNTKIAVQNRSGGIVVEVKPELWSPENPRLYEVKLELEEGGSVRDCVCEKIGFREVEVSGTSILLNGKKTFFKGISVHEDHFELGKTTNPEIIRSAIRDLKELNGCYLRLAHYPHDPRFAQIADEEGVMLWEEIPVYWAIDFQNPKTYADAENQLSELIFRDRNRASVIFWSVGNENPDTDERLAFMTKLAEKAKSLDGTRLVSAACLIDTEKLMIADRLADALDLIGINEYYGWYVADFEKLSAILTNSAPGKPVVVCEFGGGARSGQHGTEHDLFTEEKQRALYEKQLSVLGACPYIAGLTPWILYDFRCPRRLNRYQEGFNRKGLIAEDRVTRKLAFETLREFYSVR